MSHRNNMKSTGRILLFLLFISFGLVSCSSDEPLLAIQYQFDNQVWTWDDPVTFHFSSPDTVEKYNLYLEVYNQKDYPYQNLYTKIVTYFPDGDSTSQVLSLDIFDKRGRHNGECPGDLCTVQFIMQENFTFRQEGDHRIILHQQMRDDSLRFIHGLELQIFKQESLETPGVQK